MLRAELSVHTNLSDDISVVDPRVILVGAPRYDVSAIAFTNLNNVQDFHNIAHCMNPYGVKIIYGAKVYCKKENKKFLVSLLVKNQRGLKNLYKIISSIDNEDSVSCVDFQTLQEHRENLIVGFCAKKPIEKDLTDFDFCEIHPTDVNEEREFYKELCATLDIPIVAAGDCHYLHEYNEIERRIILCSKSGFEENSKLYLHTTDEMLEEFSFLGEDLAYEVVVKNSNAIADLIEKVNPLDFEVYLPKIDNCFEDLERAVYEKAKEIYGEDLPEEVSERLQQELEHLKKEEFAVRFAIAHKIVKHYNEIGLKVCSRGYIGSSLCAFLLNLSSANPLPAHYYCSKCHHYETSSDAVDGVDLPEKVCPVCGKALKKDGHNIPFESYFYFEKMANQNITINFPPSKLNEGFEVLKEMFGEDNVALGGTVVRMVPRLAQSCINYYKEKTGENFDEFGESYEQLLCENIAPVKRTNSVHPGGVFVCPQGIEFEDLTPLRQIDSHTSIKRATHLNFHDILDNVLKQYVIPFTPLDIVNDLEKTTGKCESDIDFSDSKIYELLVSGNTQGFPLFENEFLQDRIAQFKPKSFAELVKIYGFCHGTNVWVDNAENLIKAGVDFTKIPTSPDDVFCDLLSAGADSKTAFKYTNSIKKGLLARGRIKPDDRAEFKTYADKLDPLYYDFCAKIIYMCPKAHVVEYVLLTLKLAWYKVYFPQEFAQILEKYK